MERGQEDRRKRKEEIKTATSGLFSFVEKGKGKENNRQLVYCNKQRRKATLYVFVFLLLSQ